PYVIAKFAASLDGRIATRTGDSRWISGPEARAEVHRLRDRVDAVLVGVNTVLADDPELTTRLDHPERAPQHPWRLIADSRCRTPPAARVLDKTLPGRTTIFTTDQAPPERRAALTAAGAEVCVLPVHGGHVALDALLDELGRRQVTSLLVEGGAAVHGAFFDGDLVDQVLAFIAPLVIGGRDAPGAVGGAGAPLLADARRLQEPQVRRCGDDTLISGYVRRVSWPDSPLYAVEEGRG
ncbi:MAG: RibD family protein, partial [Chloroflexota bacterium]